DNVADLLTKAFDGPRFEYLVVHIGMVKYLVVHIGMVDMVLVVAGDINEFFLESDKEAQIGMSRVAADPDSDDEVIAEIIFRGKSISGDGVMFVDK
ncbi:hypothetical protein Tco_0329982, partial [Tanacetum coccineum]